LETEFGPLAPLILGTIAALISIFMINNHAGKIKKWNYTYPKILSRKRVYGYGVFYKRNILKTFKTNWTCKQGISFIYESNT